MTPEELAAIKARARTVARDYILNEVTGALIKEDVPALLAEVERLRAALQYIHDHEGKVCDEYELCEHRACGSSYAAWATADRALRGEP